MNLHTRSVVTMVVYAIDTTFAQHRDFLRQTLAEMAQFGVRDTAYAHAVEDQLAEAEAGDADAIHRTTIGMRRLGSRLPNGARTIGLLDDDGFHGEHGFPALTPERLAELEAERHELIFTVLDGEGTVRLAVAPNPALRGRDVIA